MPPKVFISHSSSDADVAELIINLLRSALNLAADDIRCTSVDGYRLPAGADVDEQLRDELLATPVFIGLLSQATFESAYVLFELGARWGAKKHLMPLLAPGVDAKIMRGPIAGLNALACDSRGQLLQLVQDTATELDMAPEAPAVYSAVIDRILSVDRPAATPAAPEQLRTRAEPIDADDIIRAHCEDKWSEDFRMRSYCEKKQRQAVAELERGGPDDVPQDAFERIRAQCASKWPTDFAMRRYCEKKQLESFRELQRRD